MCRMNLANFHGGADPAIKEFLARSEDFLPLVFVLHILVPGPDHAVYVCESICMCMVCSGRSAAIATLQLLPKSEETEAICFSCQKQRVESSAEGEGLACYWPHP